MFLQYKNKNIAKLCMPNSCYNRRSDKYKQKRHTIYNIN